MMQARLSVLTALRGVAAWWVVFYHFREALGLPAGALLPRLLELGYVAVDFFFVLSGFVIFISYQQMFAAPTRGAYGRFLGRRIARIYPLHLVVLCAFLVNPIVIHLFSSAQAAGARYDPLYFLGSLALVQNWGGFAELAWNVPAWSISTEMAAYLLFPWIFIAVRRACRGIAMHFVCALALGAALAAVFTFAGCVSIGDKIPRMGLIRCVLEFALGVIAGQLYRDHRAAMDRAWPWHALAALLLVLAMCLFDQPNYLFLPLAFFFALLAFASGPAQAIPVLSSPALVYLGEISYSTYLVHYLAKDWVKFLSPQVTPLTFGIYVLAVLAASVLLYKLIELPGKAWVLGLLRLQERRAAA